MQFLVIGKDGADSGAKDRRDAAREAHMQVVKELMAAGHRWYGCVLIDDEEKIIGSMSVVDFPSEKELREWLAREPFVTGNVWQTVEVTKCNVRNAWQYNRPQEFYESRNSSAA